MRRFRPQLVVLNCGDKHTHGGALHRGTGYIEILDQLQRHLLPPPEPRDSLTAFELVFPRRDEGGEGCCERGKSRGAVIDYVQEHVTGSSRELAAAGMSVGGTSCAQRDDGSWRTCMHRAFAQSETTVSVRVMGRKYPHHSRAMAPHLVMCHNPPN